VAGIHRVDASLAGEHDRVPLGTQRHLELISGKLRCALRQPRCSVIESARPCAIAWLATATLVGSFHEVTDHATLHARNCGRKVGAMTRLFTTGVLVAASALARHDGANAQTFTDHAVPPDGRPPFTATLSNNAPLAIGMNVEETSRVLGQPLHYVSGPPRAEIYLALRNL